MLYLTQVVAYSGILWLLYLLLLKNRPMHAYNRIFLLCAAVLPTLMPLLQLPERSQQVIDAYRPLDLRLPEITITDDALRETTTEAVSWIWISYMIVASVMFLWMICNWILLYRTIRKAEVRSLASYSVLVNTGFGPGSWGNYIILPNEEQNETVIIHELAHIRLRHSADIVLLALLKCMFWPNVFLYMISKELKQVHEFQADQRSATDKEAYGQLLIADLFSACTLPLTHSFIIHPIKRRIMMLNKKQNKAWNNAIGMMTMAGGALILCSALILQSCKTKKWEVTKEGNVTDLSRFPQLPYGETWNLYANKHMVYPKKAKEKGLEGSATVRFTVAEDGRVVNARIVKSTDTLFSEAALDLVDGMPKWLPGEKNGEPVPVEMMMPLSFQLKDKPTATTVVTLEGPESADKDVVLSKASVAEGKQRADEAKRRIEKAKKEIEAAQKEIKDAEAQMAKR